MKKGLFITIEGVEGVGKSTILETLQSHFLFLRMEIEVTREPGGTPVAESIRQTLLSQHDEAMHPDTELLLMFASRAQHVISVIAPALARGKTVICDRYIDASYAYQGGGRGIALERIAVLEHWLQPHIVPNLTLLLDAPVNIGIERMAQRNKKDRIESEQIEFFERVRETYLSRAVQYKDRYRIIDATRSLDAVKEQVITVVDEYLHETV